MVISRTAAAGIVFALLFVGCITDRPPHLSTPVEIPQDPDGSLTLYVWNTSPAIKNVDVTVRINGCIAVSDLFSSCPPTRHRRFIFLLPVGTPNWKVFHFSLCEGVHVLTAESLRGGAQLNETFKLRGKRWATLVYGYRRECDGVPVPRHFEFRVYHKPIGAV